MNIFALHQQPRRAAMAHADYHVNKMLLEAAQMLCDAHHFYNDAAGGTYYKPLSTHRQHPSNVWVRTNTSNYRWALSLFWYLHFERSFRWPRKPVHKSVVDLSTSLATPPRGMPKGRRTPFALALQDFEGDPADPVGSYRMYYLAKKYGRTARYTRRHRPAWARG